MLTSAVTKRRRKRIGLPPIQPQVPRVIELSSRCGHLAYTCASIRLVRRTRHAHAWMHSAFRRGCVGTVFSAALSYADVSEFYSLIIMKLIIKVGVDSENVSLTSEGLPILARLRAVYPMFLLSQLTDDFKVKKRTMCVCVCVCVFFPFILDIKFVGRTSRGHTGGRSHIISHPPSFYGACLNFSREKDSAIPFPRRL